MLRICYYLQTACCDVDTVCQVRCKIPGSEFAAYAGLPGTCQIEGPPFFREWWAFFIDRPGWGRVALVARYHGGELWRVSPAVVPEPLEAMEQQSEGDGEPRCSADVGFQRRRIVCCRGRRLPKWQVVSRLIGSTGNIAIVFSAGTNVGCIHAAALFCSVSRHNRDSNDRLGEDSDARNCRITRWSDPRLKFSGNLDKVP